MNYTLNDNNSMMRQLINQPILTNYQSTQSGSQNLRVKQSHSLSLNYHFVDLFKKKILVFSGLILKSNPAMYINNVRYSNIYSLDNYIPYDKRINMAILYTRAEKLIPATKSRVIFDINSNTSKAYISNNNIIRTSSVFNYTTSTEIIHKIGEWLSLDLQAEYGHSTQKTSTINTLIQKFNWYAISDFSISDKMNLSLQAHQINNFSTIASTQRIFLADASFDYQIIHSKLQFTADWHNIFNKKWINNVYSSWYYNQTSSYSIRSTGVLSLTYKF